MNPKSTNTFFIRSTLILLSLFFLFQKTTAQEFMGGEILLQRIAPLTSFNYSATVYMLVSSPSPTINKPYVLLHWGDGTGDTLKGGNPQPFAGMFNLTFTGLHTYPGSGFYQVSVVDSFYKSNIVNIPNSSQQKFQLRTILNIYTKYGSNAMSANPYRFDSIYCTNVALAMMSNSDPDGDSLSYGLVAPPIPGYIMPPATINSTSGTITFTGSVNGLYALSVEQTEWRKPHQLAPHDLISSSRKELMIQRSGCIVGINENSFENNFSLFPNPTSGVLYYQNHLSGPIQLQIHNSLSQCIYESQIEAAQGELGLQNLADGIYFLEYHFEIQTKTIKVVKH